MNGEGLLTVRDIARHLGRSEETVRRWIWSGKLPARKLGNQLFVDPADLEAMLSGTAAREVQAPYRPQGGTEMKHGENVMRLPADRMEYDMERMEALMARARDLREKIFHRAGYIDVAEAVRESREGH